MKRKKAILDSYLNHKDAAGVSRTIYDVDNWTIVRKNFVAGISRSAGGWFFNLVIVALLAYILLPIFGPTLRSFLDQVQQRLDQELPAQVQVNLNQKPTP